MNKRYLFILLGLTLLYSCSTPAYLSKTVWYSLSPAEKDGVKGSVMTSLYFLSDSSVDIYSSVIVDTNVIVKPFKIAAGNYLVSGNPKKEAQISITAKTLKKETVKYNGAFHKTEAMILVSQDSIPKVYGKLPNIKIP
jgi:hypothetical protein